MESLPRFTLPISDQGTELPLSKLGIDVAARAISAKQQNTEDTWLERWAVLAKCLPESGLHSRLLQDVQVCQSVYNQIRQGSPRYESIDDISMTVVGKSDERTLTSIGPKGLGGHAWKANDDYLGLQSEWSAPGFAPLGPCTSFGFLSFHKKVIPAHNRKDCDAMQLLCTVDYDFDLLDGNKTGMTSALAIAARNIRNSQPAMQGAALVALISFDLQMSVRLKQQVWSRNEGRAWNLGPSDIEPNDWVAATIADCGALCAFGYQSASEYSLGRTGMFTAMLLANTHDLIYDMGCSNRMSSVSYAAAAGVTDFDISCAFSATMMDLMAERILKGNSVLFGDSAAFTASLWSPFNGRYSTWERFVKYTRLLQHSGTSRAIRILKNAKARRVLKSQNISLDVPTGVAWGHAVDVKNVSDLSPRVTQSYPVPSGAQVLDAPGVSRPALCEGCTSSFESAIGNSGDDEILAIPGLPVGITSCAAVGIAAAIRRSAIWATTPSVCDACACKVGCWADSVAYLVLVAMMKSEPETDSTVWLLQCYCIWSVTVSPISVASLLSGFDLSANLNFEKGAMGGRDVVDY